MEKQLPKNWVETDLDTVVLRMTNGSSLKQEEEPFEGSLPISRIETIWNETIDLDRVKYVDASEDNIKKYALQKGDVLFSHINSDKHLGKTAVFNLDETIIHGINLLLLRAIPQFNGDLLNYILRHYRFSGKFIEVAQRSVNQSSINQKKLKSFVVPLPPLAEQQRIVDKLDTLFGHLDTLNIRLNSIPQQLKNFRQAVLTQAVTGKITEEWRKGKELDANQDIQLIKEVKLSLLKKGSLKKNKLEPIKNEELIYDLCPKVWSKCIFDDLFKFIDYRGKTPQKTPKGLRLITAKNIKMGFLSNDPIEFMSENAYKDWMTRGFPRKGDIFFVTEGHTMGNVALNNRGDEFALAQRTLTLQPFTDLSTSFFYYLMMESRFQRLVDDNATGTAAKGIKAAKFKNLPLLFPSKEEQTEIVKRVESLFSKADKIEVQYKRLKTKIDSLPHAIVAKAFKGELVEQLDSDGDAKELLEEIKALRKSMVKQSVKRKKKTK